MAVKVSLREITRDNIRAVLALKVDPEQQRLVPPVGDMIARATLEIRSGTRPYTPMKRRWVLSRFGRRTGSSPIFGG